MSAERLDQFLVWARERNAINGADVSNGDLRTLDDLVRVFLQERLPVPVHPGTDNGGRHLRLVECGPPQSAEERAREEAKAEHPSMRSHKRNLWVAEPNPNQGPRIL